MTCDKWSSSKLSTQPYLFLLFMWSQTFKWVFANLGCSKNPNPVTRVPFLLKLTVDTKTVVRLIRIRSLFVVVSYVILELREETWAALVIQTRWRLKVCIKPLNCVFTRPPCIQIFWEITLWLNHAFNMSPSHFVGQLSLSL